MLTEDEMIAAVHAAASLGVTKLRITGGEPLVSSNILSICERAARVPGMKEVCITTNGLLLPELAGDLRAAGVSRINLSLDTLNPQKYAYITRGGRLEQAMAGLDAAVRMGFERIKINAVLIGGFNDDEIEALAHLTMEFPVDVRFIELMPMLDHPEFGEDALIPHTKVLEKLTQLQPVPSEGSVEKRYHLPGAKGHIGLISPVSAPFCASCNRIRLTADGSLKPCLHSPDEISLKGMTEEEMRSAMRRAIFEKPACHAALSSAVPSRAGRSMNQIGG